MPVTSKQDNTPRENPGSAGAQRLQPRVRRYQIRSKWKHRKKELNGVALHWVEAGEGPAVLFLHGFPDFWYSWVHQLSALSQNGYRAIALDMRGYNASGKPEGIASYSIPSIVADVAALVTDLDVRVRAIVGHDWGGMIAWHFAEHHPELLERLIAINAPHPLAVKRALRRSKQRLRFWYQLFFQLPRIPEWLLSFANFVILRRTVRRLSHSEDAFSDGDLDRYVKAWNREGALQASLNYYRALFRSCQAETPADATGKFLQPSLLIWGDSEPFFIPESAEWSREFANLKIMRLAGCGHFAHLDRPDDVCRLILDFMREENA